MWAAAFLTFLLVPGLGAALLLSAAVTTYVKSTKVDAEYAKRGELPPTARLVEAWLNRQKKAGKVSADATVKPYGSRAYAKQRWAAFWEDLGDKHREERAAHQRAVAEAKKNGTPPPAAPAAKDRLKGWKWAIDKLTRPVGDKPSTAEPAPDPTGPEPKPVSDGPVIKCDECGATLATLDGGHQHPDGSTCTKAWPAAKPQQASTETRSTNDRGPGGAADPPATAVPVPDSADPRAEMADRHRPVLDPDQNPEPEGEHMTTSTQTQQSGEVVGLQSAINYADAVAAAHAQHSIGGGEQYRASLAGAKVGPETIQSAASAQELSEMAAAAWAAHADKLREQLAAKEHTTAETGTKEFLLND